MRTLTSLLPKVLVFGVSVVIGAVVASVVVGALQNEGPVSTAGVAPEYLLQGPDTPSGPGVPVAFDERVTGEPAALAQLPPEDLEAATEALLGGETVAFTSPTGFPRITPITQFDGGPMQGSNCTMASGAMLARLAYGIVTTGSHLRTLQFDWIGGTDFADLSVALWRGYGVSPRSGLIRPGNLKDLLAAGYGAVIQGAYSKIPRALRLQKDFTGGHAIYLDGYYPGNLARGIPEAYYVIDPIGRPKWGYLGEWWPARVIDDFATSFAGGNRIAAMWAFPPGGVPPEVSLPDVVSIPPADPGEGGQGPSAEPGTSGVPAAPSGLVITPSDPGDLDVQIPGDDPPIRNPRLGGQLLVPILDICLVTPRPAGCPSGIEAVFEAGSRPVLELPRGPDVQVVSVDSDRPNIAIVAYAVDSPGPSAVRYWEADGSPATIRNASSMTSIQLPDGTLTLARLDVAAGTTYRFQVVAGDGRFASSSPAGSFTTGDGLAKLDVSLSEAASPSYRLATGPSPYLHLAAGAYAQPMLPLASLDGASCIRRADFGGTAYCVELASVPPASTCIRARVTYELTGLDTEGMLVRAFPTVAGRTEDGGMTLEGVLEADGPSPAGEVSVGCLAPGLSYTIVLDAVGDDRGILGTQTISVPSP